MGRDAIYLDCETTGFQGPIVLVQWARGVDGVIKLHEPWHSTIDETVALFEMFANHQGGLIAFNMVFDYFHIYQMWTVLKLLQENGWGEDVLADRMEEYAEFEPRGRDCPLCLKPVKCLDLMLHARKGPYQSTMNRSDIRIRRVPSVLAWQLSQELDSRITFPSILFAKKKSMKNKPKWHVYDVHNAQGENVPEFKDVVLKFHPSVALKALAYDALKLKEDAILLFRDISVPKQFNPVEIGYAPFAKAIGDRKNWKGSWPDVIRHHIAHWRVNDLARQYASKDVWYLQKLDAHFGFPEMGDDDSELTACVACVRWRGYRVDLDGLKQLKKDARAKKWKMLPDGKKIKIPTAPKQVRHYVGELLDPAERLTTGIDSTTKRVVIEAISNMFRDCSCLAAAIGATQVNSAMSFEDMLACIETQEAARADPNCKICGGSGKVKHPAGQRAREVLEARQADKERELYDKLILAGRFHAAFNVIGALSSRMSGSEQLNAQGIKNDQKVRSCFPLALGDHVLCGGDFSGFEVSLAEACYKDPELRKDLLTCEKCDGHMECREGDFFCTKCGGKDGKAIHALFGMFVYPGMDYNAIKHTKKDGAGGIYDRSKKAVFAMFYGGESYTLRTRLGVSEEVADQAFASFLNRYPGVKRAQQRIEDDFKSMKQPGGLGRQVIWTEPKDKVESMLGFPRYFTLENMICKTLYDLANNPPRDWRDLKIKVLRRIDKEQFASGAVQSALFGAAFQIQSGNVRAAKNHEIQSTGAQITKNLQRNIWSMQPSGVHKWTVQPCNIHDEVLVPCDNEVKDKVGQIVKDTVESFRPKVPLIKMEWKTNLKSWAEKG